MRRPARFLPGPAARTPAASRRKAHLRQAGGDEHHQKADAECPGQVADLDDFHPAMLRVPQAGKGHAGQQIGAGEFQAGPNTGAATIAGTPSRWTAARHSPMNAGK